MNHYRSDKRDAFSRAEALLAEGGDAELRYACLELRLCMESLAYEKLLTYTPRGLFFVQYTRTTPTSVSHFAQWIRYGNAQRL